MLDIRIVVGLIALVTAVFSSLVTFVCGRYASEKDEKREMYAQAYKSLVRWKEMVYKVSRRKKEDESEIRSEFHEIQVDAAFYEGWIAGSSPSLSKSFIFSMNGVKACCKDPIHKAWDRSGSEGDVGELIDNKKIREFTTSFIKDIRLQLSPWLIPHIILWMHNRRRD
jgi:hypothetical protein